LGTWRTAAKRKMKNITLNIPAKRQITFSFQWKVKVTSISLSGQALMDTKGSNCAPVFDYAHVRKFGSPDDIGTTGQLTPFLGSQNVEQAGRVRRRVSRPAHMRSAPTASFISHWPTYSAFHTLSKKRQKKSVLVLGDFLLLGWYLCLPCRHYKSLHQLRRSPLPSPNRETANRLHTFTCFSLFYIYIYLANCSYLLQL